MKSTLLQVSKQRELPELFQHSSYGCDMSISVIISVDKDVIQVHYDKDVNLLSKDLVDISLEACRHVI